MAFVDDEDTEDQGSTNPSQNGNSALGQTPAQTGQFSTAVDGGAKGSSFGTSSSSAPSLGPTQAGTPSQAASQGGHDPIFTNLSSFETENQPATQGLANQISGNINNAVSTAQNQLGTSQNLFNTDVAGGTVNLNQGVIDSATGSPTTFAANPDNVSALNAMLNATYSGPLDFNSDTAASTPANSAVNNAQALAQNVNSPSGREQLIQSATNNGNPALAFKQPQSTGNLSLDNALIQNTPGTLDQIQTAAKTAAPLSTDIFNIEQASLPQVQTAATTTANTKATTGSDLQNALTAIQNNVTTNAQGLQTQATANQTALANALQTGAALTPAQEAGLGITDAEYQNLLTQENALKTAEGPNANLATLGAEWFGGFNPSAGAPTPTATSPASPFLGQILSAGSSAVSGAEIASAINSGSVGSTLTSLGLGGLAQSLGIAPSTAVGDLTSAEVAQLSAPPVDIADLSGADDIGSAVDVGDTAGSVADIGGEAAADSAADYLPYVGAALALAQIFENGTIGNGQGGVSGALSGAGEGAAIGTAIYPGIGTAVGAAIGAILGGLLGSTPSVGPNGDTQIGIDSTGKLVVGATGADNGADPQQTITRANQAVAGINALLPAAGMMINPSFFGTAAGANFVTAIDQGEAGGDNVGAPGSASGLFYWLMQNNAIIPDPNAPPVNTQPYNLSADLTATNPTTTITAANAATPQQYADYGALNQLLTGSTTPLTQGTFLTPTNATQAGTATPYSAAFNYNDAATQLANILSSAKSTGVTEGQQALNILKQGLIP